MNRDTITITAERMKALGNNERLAIVSTLSGGKKNVETIRADVSKQMKRKSSQSGVSQHLSRLRLAGLVIVERRGVERLYSLREVNLLGIRQAIDTIVEVRP